MASRRPRAELVPNANNPRLLIRLLGLIASGMRRPRVLSETLDVELRTVHYYTQAAQWLGLIEEGSELQLSPRGLEVAYAPSRHRTRAYADAVWRTPFVVELLQVHTELPSAEQIATFIVAHDRSMAQSTARRRASAVRSLIAPALPWRPSAREAVGEQLGLPLATHPTRRPAGLGAPLVAAADLSESPDVYARLLMVLLDHGELATQHIRAVLDRVGGSELPLGTYVQMALRRGDAIRTEHGLAATAGAAQRREVAGDAVLVGLTDPDYRAGLDQLLEADDSPQAQAELRRRAARYARWDLRLFGERLRADTVSQALHEALPGRTLRGLAPAGDPGPELPCTELPFLESLDTPGLGVSFPSSLVELGGGVSTLNPQLHLLRTRPGGVRLPTVVDPRARIHGGLLVPGRTPPRALTDNLSLRLEAIHATPAVALSAALGLLARRPSDGLNIVLKGEKVTLKWRGRRIGGLIPTLCELVEAWGWRLVHPPSGGLRDHELIDALASLGVLQPVSTGFILSERLFLTLQGEPEARPVYDGLLALEDRVHAWLDALEQPRRGPRARP